MALWEQTNGRLRWFYFAEDIGDPDWKRYVDGIHSTAMSASMRNDSAWIFTFSYGSDTPNAAQRQLLTEMIKTLPPDAIGAHAIVTNSRLIRGVVTAIDWIVPRPYRRIFAEPGEAFEWFSTRSAEFDRDVLVRALRATVPNEALFPSLQRNAAPQASL